MWKHYSECKLCINSWLRSEMCSNIDRVCIWKVLFGETKPVFCFGASPFSIASVLITARGNEMTGWNIPPTRGLHLNSNPSPVVYPSLLLDYVLSVLDSMRCSISDVILTINLCHPSSSSLGQWTASVHLKSRLLKCGCWLVFGDYLPIIYEAAT